MENRVNITWTHVAWEERRETNAPFTEVDNGSTFAVHVKRLGFAWELEHHTVKVGAKIGGRYGDPFSIRKSLETVLREECHEEIECILVVNRAREGTGAAAVAAGVWSKGWGRDYGGIPLRDIPGVGATRGRVGNVHGGDWDGPGRMIVGLGER